MSIPSKAPDPSRHNERKREHHRSRSQRFLPKVMRFWRHWRAEVIIAILILLAVFLLVERMNIRQSLYAGLVGLLGWFGSLFTGLSQALQGLFRRATLSDLLAYLLLAIVVGLVFWRTRQRLLAHPRLTDQNCPRCGGDMHRIHRRIRDRLLNAYLPVRRYQCKDSECRWRGLRVYPSQEA